MKKETKEARKKLLSEISQLELKCDGCETRSHFNRLKDASALTNACRECPIYAETSQYGAKLLSLTEPRVKIKISKK